MDRLDLYGTFSRIDREVYFHQIIVWSLKKFSKQKPDFDFYFNRIHFANPMTPESLAAIGNDLTEASAGILPGYDLDMVVFNCTSSSSIISS